MDEKSIKDLIEGTKLVVGLHMELFNSYMKMTDGDVELSINLSRDALNIMLNMGTKEETK